VECIEQDLFQDQDYQTSEDFFIVKNNTMERLSCAKFPHAEDYNMISCREQLSQSASRTVQRRLLPRRRSYPRTKDLSPLIKTSRDVGLSRLINDLEMSGVPEDDFFLLAPEETTSPTSSENTQQRLLPRRRSTPSTPIDPLPYETQSPLQCEPAYQWIENTNCDSKFFVTPPISSTIVQRKPTIIEADLSRIKDTRPLFKRSDSDELSQISDKLGKAGVPRDEFFLVAPGEVNRDSGDHIPSKRVAEMSPSRALLETEEQTKWTNAVLNQQQTNAHNFFSPILPDDESMFTDRNANC